MITSFIHKIKKYRIKQVIITKKKTFFHDHDTSTLNHKLKHYLKLPITETPKKSKITITVACKAKQNSTKKTGMIN